MADGAGDQRTGVRPGIVSDPSRSEPGELRDQERRDALVYARILESMRDGVVTIDLGGRIVTFNQAAGRILDKDPSAVIGRLFAEAFVADESFDDFNEVVFNAIFEGLTTHSRDISLTVGDRTMDLYVSTSFLTLDGGEGDEGRRYGVVIVFSDVTEGRKRRKIKRLFGEYVDPRIVEEILERSERDGGGRRGRMSIAFTDLRDFTGWTERLEADQLIEVLNLFLAAMAEAVSASGGITDKFIGDAVMACWGAPFTPPETEAADACLAALRQIRALPRLRAKLAERRVPGAERLDATVGVATGEVIAGDVGSPSNRNYTMIGHAANLAARLQELTKRFHVPILVSEATRRAAGERFVFREIDRIVPRGATMPEAVYALLGPPEDVGESTRRLAASHAEGLFAMRSRDWRAAERLFAACLAIDPSDAAARIMAERVRHLSAAPPDETWDGVWRPARLVGTGGTESGPVGPA